MLAIRLALPLCREGCKSDGSSVLRYQQSETIAKIYKGKKTRTATIHLQSEHTMRYSCSFNIIEPFSIQAMHSRLVSVVQLFPGYVGPGLTFTLLYILRRYK